MPRYHLRLVLASAGLAAAAGHGGSAQEPAPAERTPKELVDAVLHACHGPFYGRFDRAVLELRAAEGSDKTTVLVDLPRAMRIDHPDHAVDLLVGGTAWRCRPGQSPEKLAGETLQADDALRQCVRGLLMVPLYRAAKVHRAGPGVLSLILPGGETWRLAVDEKTLRPTELRGPVGAVRFAEWLDTGVTRLPARVELPGLGTRRVAFLGADLKLDPVVFEDPIVPVPSGKGQRRTVQHPAPSAGGAERPRRPELQDIARRRFLVLDDPGEWSGRRRRIIEGGTVLGGAGQAPDGLPTYRRDGEHSQLLIPFHSDPSEGSPPFVRQAGQQVLYVPAHRAVVVSPAPGTWDEVLARGREQMAAFVAEKKLRRVGPLYVIPFLEPTAMPNDQQLRKLSVRLEQGVE